MNTVTSSSLQPLIDYEGNHALTIYLPTHRHPAPPNMREDQIRFKNVLRSAHEALLSDGADEQQIKAILGNLEAKQEDIDFWRHATSGMVFFANNDELQVFSLPFECDERVYVGTNFDVSPALAACSYDRPYLLLALAVHNPKLFKGSISGIEPIEIDLPTSPEDALNIDEMFINSNTIRGISTSGGGNDKLSSHGQGDSQEAGNEERLKYFRIIDHNILNAKEYDADMPLLLAGTDSEVAEYRDISNHPNILSGHVGGNHTNTQPQDLHKLAWAVVDSEMNTNQREALLDRFNQVRGAGKSSVDPDDILSAAEAGRVDTLMVGTIAATRDTISDEEGSIVKLTVPEWYDKMNISKLAKVVISQGGKLIGFDNKLMPEKAPMAAIYRY